MNSDRSQLDSANDGGPRGSRRADPASVFARYLSLLSILAGRNVLGAGAVPLSLGGGNRVLGAHLARGRTAHHHLNLRVALIAIGLSLRWFLGHDLRQKWQRLGGWVGFVALTLVIFAGGIPGYRGLAQAGLVTAKEIAPQLVPHRVYRS